jgi:hypothetical protein
VETVGEVIDRLSSAGSVWHRADIVRAICDIQRPLPDVAGERWVGMLDRLVENVLDQCVDLDPPVRERTTRRQSNGRSVRTEPIAAHVTSEAILAQEELILTWALDAQAEELRAEVAAELATERRELDEEHNRRQHLETTLAAAEQRVARATTAAAPYDAIVDRAEHAVASAVDARRSALRTLDNTKWHHRRSAREEVARTERDLASARHQLAATQEAARPTDHERVTALRELSEARHTLFYDTILDRWIDRTEHVVALERIEHALSDWHTWASGKPITWEQLASAARALDVDPRADLNRRYVALTLPLHAWAERRGVDLRPPPQHTIEPRGIELAL